MFYSCCLILIQGGSKRINQTNVLQTGDKPQRKRRRPYYAFTTTSVAPMHQMTDMVALKFVSYDEHPIEWACIYMSICNTHRVQTCWVAPPSMGFVAGRIYIYALDLGRKKRCKHVDVLRLLIMCYPLKRGGGGEGSLCGEPLR